MLSKAYTGDYKQPKSEKSLVTLTDGRSLLTQAEAVSALLQLENQYKKAGYWQSSQQPVSERLAVNLRATNKAAASGSTPKPT